MRKVYILLSFVVLILISFVWIGMDFFGEKKLVLIFPNGKEKIEAGKEYLIKWKSKKIRKIGILLLKGEEKEEGKWIVRDFPARKGEFKWKVFAWEEPREDYKIAIFEYPWKEGNKIDYSDDFFTILGPQFASCDTLSLENEWPYLPSDYPGLRKVFITEQTFRGDLGGLEGADQKCQQEAKERGFEGEWKAFLGDDMTSATERLNLDGIFVKAQPEGVIPNQRKCFRLLGKNFEEFLKKLQDFELLNKERFDEKFLEKLKNVWLGRITKESKRECVEISNKHSLFLSDIYSFTVTCQNWHSKEDEISTESSLPFCYTKGGERVRARGLAGLSSGIVDDKFSISLGKSCDTPLHLICIQQ